MRFEVREFKGWAKPADRKWDVRAEHAFSDLNAATQKADMENMGSDYTTYHVWDVDNKCWSAR